MRRVDRLGVIAALGIALAVAPSFAGNVTVGRFYTELAKAKHVVAVNAPSAEASLRRAGVNLPRLALDKSLTEGDLVSISRSLGLAVTTGQPAQLVSKGEVIEFLSSFGSQIGAPTLRGGGGPFQSDSQGGDPGQSGNGKGKKKGHNKSASEPL